MNKILPLAGAAMILGSSFIPRLSAAFPIPVPVPVPVVLPVRDARVLDRRDPWRYEAPENRCGHGHHRWHGRAEEGRRDHRLYERRDR
jgi:hypothetical protein